MLKDCQQLLAVDGDTILDLHKFQNINPSYFNNSAVQTISFISYDIIAEENVTKKKLASALTARTNVQDDKECNPLVQIAVLHGYGDREASQEHHIGLLHVDEAHLPCRQDPQQREREHWNEGGDGQGDRLRHPVHGHDEDDVPASRFLKGKLAPECA